MNGSGHHATEVTGTGLKKRVHLETKNTKTEPRPKPEAGQQSAASQSPAS